EADLRNNRRQFEEMANTAPVMLWITGPDGQLSFVNDQWLTLTGLSLPEVLGIGWQKAIHPDDLEMLKLQPVVNNIPAGPANFEYRLRRYDGEFRWINASGVPRLSS